MTEPDFQIWTINEPTIASLRIRAIEALIKQNHYQNLDILFEHAEKITAYCLGILKNEQ